VFLMWEWLGEPLAVDFANTVRRRGREYEECLSTPEDFEAWAAAEDVDPGEFELTEVLAFRDAVLSLLQAAARAEPPPRRSEAALNQALRRCPLLPQLRGGRVVLTAPRDARPLDELHALIAASALEVLEDPLLALCDAPSCGQLFMRHRGDQRWCGPACGTRARVAKHAAARRA
jgi:predicted RNA-binding Zn ribbon-like protein